MQTATTAATSLKVGTILPRYRGPLKRFLEKQKEASTDAATLRSMRACVLGLVEDPYLFSEAERQRTVISVTQCQSIAQLQRWFRNVYSLMKHRENQLHAAYADGTASFYLPA